MGVPCEIRNNRDHEIWVGVKFSGGSGVVANLLPSQKRVLCAPPEEAIVSMMVYGFWREAWKDIPDAAIVESRPRKI